MNFLLIVPHQIYKIPNQQWVAAKTTQTPIYPTHFPKDRFTQILERRQNFTHPPKTPIYENH